LLIGLLVILAIEIIQGLVGIFLAPGFAVDLEIPLRAGERWLAGQQPYLADAFQAPPGFSLPFLYPPYTLPLLGVLSNLPRTLVDLVGAASFVACAILACRRLAIPWLWVPLFLAWPPFAEGIHSGNIQLALFAAFVYLFFTAGGSPWRPRSRDIADPATSGLMVGGLSTLVGAVKVSQPHPWVAALHHRPRAAIGGALVAGLVVAASLPLTGISPWFDWTSQLRLAGDPTWDEGGIAMSRYLPAGVGLAVAIACVVAVWFVPMRSAGAWIGILSVVGSLSLHTFGLLFLLPAMLIIRREISLLVAILIASYTLEGTWAGILLCSVAFAASTHWPILREPESTADDVGLSGQPALSISG
jgi:hypothetical protein